MPPIYLQDVKKIVGALCRDEGLISQEKLILLGIVTDHITTVTKELEDELTMCGDGLVQ